jgi:hypothetical protein
MIFFQIRHSHCQIGFATRSIKAFALASFYAPLYAAPRQLISLVDSIRVVLFLIVPVSRYGGTMFTIKTERKKACANFTIAPAGPRLAVQREGGRLLHSHLCTNTEQVAHQRAWLLHDCPPATKLRPSKNYADARFVSWLVARFTQSEG